MDVIGLLISAMKSEILRDLKKKYKGYNIDEQIEAILNEAMEADFDEKDIENFSNKLMRNSKVNTKI
eukprot:SAG22_NODE_8271_length_668_cov_1.312830_1_plen_67_part_00